MLLLKKVLSLNLIIIIFSQGLMAQSLDTAPAPKDSESALYLNGIELKDVPVTTPNGEEIKVDLQVHTTEINSAQEMETAYRHIGDLQKEAQAKGQNHQHIRISPEDEIAQRYNFEDINDDELLKRHKVINENDKNVYDFKLNQAFYSELSGGRLPSQDDKKSFSQGFRDWLNKPFGTEKHSRISLSLIRLSMHGVIQTISLATKGKPHFIAALYGVNFGLLSASLQWWANPMTKFLEYDVYYKKPKNFILNTLRRTGEIGMDYTEKIFPPGKLKNALVSTMSKLGLQNIRTSPTPLASGPVEMGVKWWLLGYVFINALQGVIKGIYLIEPSMAGMIWDQARIVKETFIELGTQGVWELVTVKALTQDKNRIDDQMQYRKNLLTLSSDEAARLATEIHKKHEKALTKAQIAFLAGSATWAFALVSSMQGLDTLASSVYVILPAAAGVRYLRMYLMEKNHPIMIWANEQVRKSRILIDSCKRFLGLGKGDKVSLNNMNLRSNTPYQVIFSQTKKSSTDNYFHQIDSLHTNLTNLGRRLA